MAPSKAVMRLHADLPLERWLNNRGWTRQVWISESPGPSWRLSVAEIGEAGPFSRFPQINRTLVVASDALLHLQVDGTSHSSAFAETVTFPGEASVMAATDDDEYPVVVLNLMVKRGEGVGMVVVRRDGRAELATTVTAFTLLSGRVAMADGRELNKWDSLVLGPTSLALTFHDAVVAEIHVTTPPHTSP